MYIQFFMKTSKVKNMNIIPPKSESGLYSTDTHLPKMHQRKITNLL